MIILTIMHHGKGFYDYSLPIPKPNTNHQLGEQIFIRILAMLINEAADAVYLNIASKEDIYGVQCFHSNLMRSYTFL